MKIKHRVDNVRYLELILNVHLDIRKSNPYTDEDLVLPRPNGVEPGADIAVTTCKKMLFLKWSKTTPEYIYRMTFDNDVHSLQNELDHEKSNRDTAAWQNDEAEKHIMALQEDLQKNDFPSECDENLQKENFRNKQLLEGNSILREQLPLLREKIKNARICGPDCKLKHDDLNINLEILSQAELLRTLKKFERSKTDLVCTLRSKEWRLDSESKLFTRLFDQKTYLQNQLLIYQNNITRLQKGGRMSKNSARLAADTRLLEKKMPPIISM